MCLFSPSTCRHRNVTGILVDVIGVYTPRLGPWQASPELRRIADFLHVILRAPIQSAAAVSAVRHLPCPLISNQFLFFAFGLPRLRTKYHSPMSFPP